MIPTTRVNGLTVVHKNSDGTIISGPPDVCKTPTPGGPVPVPYVNVAFSKHLVKGTPTVQVDGQPIAVRLRVPTRYTPPRVDMTAWFDALGDDGASASPQDERVRLPRRKTPAVEPER